MNKKRMIKVIISFLVEGALIVVPMFLEKFFR